jgi:methyl-accepting chemotaxis protein
MADFKADILPPPLYLVEPFMEATSLVEERTEAKAASPRHVARLRELATEYDKRTAYWRASDLPLTLKAEIDRQSSGTSRRFWDEVQRNLIPAAERGDIAALHHSHDRLKSLYSEHEQAVVQLVAQTDRQEMLLEAEAARSLGRTLWLLGRLASPYLAWRLSPCALFSARR